MADYFEIRWHGRGGQGTVTGAKSLGEAVQGTGRYVVAFPDYGPERRGAPLRAFNRFSDKKVQIHIPVRHPDVIIIVDPTLIGHSDIMDGLRPETVFIVNTERDIRSIKKELALTTQSVYTVPANEISYEIFGREIPNSAVMGAFARACPDVICLEKMLAELRVIFGHNFSDATVEKNLQAIERGYREGEGL